MMGGRLEPETKRVCSAIRVLVAKIERKSERWFGKQGYESNEHWDVEACDALPLFHA